MSFLKDLVKMQKRIVLSKSLSSYELDGLCAATFFNLVNIGAALRSRITINKGELSWSVLLKQYGIFVNTRRKALQKKDRLRVTMAYSVGIRTATNIRMRLL